MPVLVAAGDLPPAGVPVFRRRAPRYLGNLEELLAAVAAPAEQTAAADVR